MTALEPEGGAPAASSAAPAPAVQPAASTRSSPRWLNIALVVAVGIALAGVAFATGRATAPSALDQLRTGVQNGSGGPAFIGPNGQGGQGGQGGPLARFGGGGIALEGTVESIDADSMTVKTADGQSIEVTLDSDTSYHTAADASASAVTSGSKVVIRVQAAGQPGSGGGLNLDASDVTIVP